MNIPWNEMKMMITSKWEKALRWEEEDEEERESEWMNRTTVVYSTKPLFFHQYLRLGFDVALASTRVGNYNSIGNYGRIVFELVTLFELMTLLLLQCLFDLSLKISFDLLHVQSTILVSLMLVNMNMIETWI